MSGQIYVLRRRPQGWPSMPAAGRRTSDRTRATQPAAPPHPAYGPAERIYSSEQMPLQLRQRQARHPTAPPSLHTSAPIPGPTAVQAELHNASVAVFGQTGPTRTRAAAFRKSKAPSRPEGSQDHARPRARASRRGTARQQPRLLPRGRCPVLVQHAQLTLLQDDQEDRHR